MPAAKKQKKIPVNKYGFPSKVKLVSPKRNRVKRNKIQKYDVFLEFCRWASLPTPLREPKYQKDFATKYGVSDRTVEIWKQRQDFWETVATMRMNWAKDKTSDVVHGLFRNASTRGEASEVKLWMQMVEDWSEKQGPSTPNITVIGIKGISEEALKKLTQPQEKKDVVEAVEAEIIDNSES